MFGKLRNWCFHEATFKVLSGFYAIGTSGINWKTVTPFSGLLFCARPECLILSQMLELVCLLQPHVTVFVRTL